MQQSKIVPSTGRRLGAKGKGFIRITMGCTRKYLEQAIAGLDG